MSIVSAVAYPPASSMRALESLVLDSGGAAPSPAVELELLTVNAQRSQGAWLHVLSLRVDAAGSTAPSAAGCAHRRRWRCTSTAAKARD